MRGLVQLSKRCFGSTKRNFGMQQIESRWTDQRLDKVIMAKFGMPWGDVHRYVRMKDIFIAKGGKEVPEEERYVTKQTNYKIAYGDILCISDYLLRLQRDKEKDIRQARGPPAFSKSKMAQMASRFEDMLVYENANVMVIDKPCGVPSQQGTGLDPNSSTSVDILAANYLGGADDAAFLVHRLDKATSGLMCIAKSRAMARHLSEELSQHRVTKQYTALLSNFSGFFPFPQQGVIRQSLADPQTLWSIQDTAEGDKQRKFICSPEYQSSDLASLDMTTFFQIEQSLQFSKSEGWVPFINEKTEEDRESYHLVRFELETGKKHQLRLASAYAFGAPIVGDFKYDYDSQLFSSDLLRRSFKYTKLQERRLFQDSILLHSSKLQIPIETGVETPKTKTFESNVTMDEINSAEAFVKVLQQLNIQ